MDESTALQMIESKGELSADDLSRSLFTQYTGLSGLRTAVTTLLSTEE
jgi:hypothetical protein